MQINGTFVLISVASTSWQTVFLKLENDSKHLEEDLPYRTMFRMAPSSSKEFETISRHFFNFLLVRHPLCRLVSAYQDRVRGCKMKAEWYARGKYFNNQTKENKYPCILVILVHVVEKALRIQEGLQCFAHSSTGKIQFKPGEKLSVEKRQVFIPTFE